MKKLVLFFVLCGFAFQCWSQNADKISFSLFLIGYSGKYKPDDSAQTAMLKAIQDYHANPKAVLFTGNNVFPSLSETLSGNFDEQKTSLQYQSWRNFQGTIGMVPGLTDWAYGTDNGKDMVKWEYKTMHKLFAGKNFYMPDWACPGPVEIPLTDSLTVILIDTQWWLHPFDTRLGKCDLEDESDVWINLQDALRRNRNKQTVVVGYHPIVSYGEFGGHYSTAASIFGFPVALYRKLLGTRFDLSYPDYQQVSSRMRALLEEFPNIIYASSHERNFQYLTENKVHYIIGGSLAGGTYIKEKKLTCGDREAGFSRIDFYKNGKVVLNFFPEETPDQAFCQSTLYTYQAKANQQISLSGEIVFPESIAKPASTEFSTSQRAIKWMGRNYRDVWVSPVEIPVFDITKEHGGLEIIKRGGGQQTHSLRLKDKQGHQYSLRSLQKFVEGALPEDVQNTFAVDIVQDNISASNPYAALPVAQLADFAGVMHTNPKIVYIPDDDRLGEYKEDLAGHLFLYEERPAGNWSKTKSFGYSANIVGTDDVLEATEDSPQHRVDQQAVLRARIFDTAINDWDRHDDQWRWASFKQGKETFYRPIPRDRDQAFYLNEGILPRIASRKWLMPKIQGFAPLTENMNGLAFNARYFDRTFLTQPDWNQWKATVDSIKTSLTDENIDKAMLAFPKEIQPLCAKRIATILKQRRDNLEEMAREHYLALAKNVNITGSDKNDRFCIFRKNSHQTEVSVFENTAKSNSNPYYHRIFNSDETKEIRLYGLNGDDLFSLDGEVNKGIKIRIIGGKGNDTISNQSLVDAPGKHLFVYDTWGNTQLKSNKDTRNLLSFNKSINYYNRMDFHYDVVSPGVFLGYNPDDGVFLGGGPVFSQNKFRRNETHSIMANFAAKTTAFNVRYMFDSESLSRTIDQHFSIDLKAPDYAMNYFGMGNKTKKSELHNNEYYRLRVNQLTVNYALGHRWGKTASKTDDNKSVNLSEVRLGIFMKRSNIEEKPGYFIADLGSNGLSLDQLKPQIYSGLSASYNYSNLNSKIKPERGFSLALTGNQFFQMNAEKDQFLQLNADFRAYISFTKNPRTVLAYRLGGTAIVGDHPFIEAARLGGKTNLRGYRADRFYGDQSVYQNIELRYKLANFSSYILNGEFGTLLFHDSGRVWYNDENSKTWHKGYGGGLWLSPFEMTIFTLTYNHSREDNLIQVSMNFKF